MVLSVERARTIVYGDRRKATGPVHYLRIDQVSVDHLSGFSHIQCALVDKGTGDLQSPLYGEIQFERSRLVALKPVFH